MKHLSRLRLLALMVVCIGLNLGIGFIVTMMKAPLYLDSIGTVVATALGGLWVGIPCGVISVIVGSAYTPTLWAYAGTMAAIALYVRLVRPVGYLSKLLPTALLGIGLGVMCAIVSAPVTTYVWKGVSLSGADALAAFFSSKGVTPLVSVILTGLATDPIDKLVTSLVALALVTTVPTEFFFDPGSQGPTGSSIGNV
jgi:energy-coupling factor transport system substrate-specific component